MDHGLWTNGPQTTPSYLFIRCMPDSLNTLLHAKGDAYASHIMKERSNGLDKKSFVASFVQSFVESHTGQKLAVDNARDSRARRDGLPAGQQRSGNAHDKGWQGA